jgi:hypothetical protein
MNDNPSSSPLEARKLLDLYYLDLRCHLLEVAAGFDRIERASGGAAALADPRAARLRASLDILASPAPDRAERFLNLFSE